MYVVDFVNVSLSLKCFALGFKRSQKDMRLDVSA